MPVTSGLCQLGIDLEHEPRNVQEVAASERVRAEPADRERKEHLIERGGVRYAGTHLILDLWGARRLDDLEHVEATLRGCVEAAGASLLHIHLHHFPVNKGISGVAVLAESHISVHTWPERGYAALDIFMCGRTKPFEAIEVLRRAFRPERLTVREHLRGRIP